MESNLYSFKLFGSTIVFANLVLLAPSWVAQVVDLVPV
jgi:hypothetical protein